MLPDRSLCGTAPACSTKKTWPSTPAPDALRTDEGALREDYVERVAQAVGAGDTALLRELVGDLHEADVGDLIEALDAELRPRLVELMGPDFDFAALTEVDDTIREEILEELPTETVAEGVRDLDSDDAVAILEDLPKDEQDEILDQLPAPERVALARSLDYPENSAGRRMQDEFIAVEPHWTVGQTIDYMREKPDLPDRFWELYVVDHGPPAHRRGRTRPAVADQAPGPDRRTYRRGTVARAAPPTTRRKSRACSSVTTWCRRRLSTRDGRLVGVITFDDIVDVIEEEAEEDIKALGGVRSEEELSDSVWTIAKGRFNWLLVNLATAFLASSVLGLFEGELEKMVALAVLAPIVASQGGNAATQTMTVAVRALATARTVERQCLRGSSCANCWSALLNGVAFAVITGVAAAAWFKIPDLGVVIGLAMICNLVARRAGRHPDSARARSLALRSGGLLRGVRDHRDRRRRLLLVPRYRDALVRVAVNQRSWRLPPSVVGRVADASAGRAFTASSPSCVNPSAQQFVFCAL